MPDYADVAELFASYGAAVDGRNFDRLRHVFMPDATFTVETADGPTVGPHQGGDAIVEFFSGAALPDNVKGRHVITNPRVDGDRGYALLSFFVAANGQVTLETTGDYQAEFAQEDGTLRFASLHLSLDRQP